MRLGHEQTPFQENSAPAPAQTAPSPCAMPEFSIAIASGKSSPYRRSSWPG